MCAPSFQCLEVTVSDLNTYFRHCGVTGTVIGGGLLLDLDLLLCVLPLDDLAGFFFLLETSLAPDKLSDLFLLFEALVTLLKVEVTFILKLTIRKTFI